MSVTLPTGTMSSETPPARRRRVLLIAYSFPPVGGAGVQRPTKWVKYLPQFGWDVTVLTPSNPSVPVRDESLLAEIPSETRIIHAQTLEPDYRVKQQLAQTKINGSAGWTQTIRTWGKGVIKRAAQIALQPDAQVLWVRNALKAAAAELQRVPHDAILVTVPPYSMLSIGAALKKRFGIPVVFDFRDEWDLSSRYLEQVPRGWWSNLVQSRMQRRLLKQADAVLATTQASTQAYQVKLAEVGNSAPAHCIYNGYDPEDFTDSKPPTESSPASDVFRLVYTGTLWNLTDIEPLVQAIEALHQESPGLLKKLELVCIGRKTPEQQQILDRVRQTHCQAVFHDYCHHKEVAGWLNRAQALCLLLSDVPGAERVVPAKLFEYLATRKSILSIVPHGESARIVRRFLPEGHFVPRDVAGISGWLKDRLLQLKYVSTSRAPEELLEEYSRPMLTARLADVLNSVSGVKPLHVPSASSVAQQSPLPFAEAPR